MHFRLGGLYEEKGDHDAAAQHLQACLAIEPSNAKACNHLGYMFAEQGTNLDEAEALIKRALEIEPQNGYYLDSLGWVYYQDKQMEKAIEFLELAVKHLDHDDAIVRDHLGDAHFAAGAVEDAISQWRKALRLDPENETIKEKLQKHQPDVQPVETDRN
jgi:tetratricopeptide (TPR) repeat protein